MTRGISAKKQPVPFFKKAKDGKWYHWTEYIGKGNLHGDLSPFNWIKEEIRSIGNDFAVFNIFAPAKDIRPGDVIYAPGVKDPTVTDISRRGEWVRIGMSNNAIPHAAMRHVTDPVFIQASPGVYDPESYTAFRAAVRDGSTDPDTEEKR